MSSNKCFSYLDKRVAQQASQYTYFPNYMFSLASSIMCKRCQVQLVTQDRSFQHIRHLEHTTIVY